MAAILPFLTFWFVFLSFYDSRPFESLKRREALLAAAVVTGALFVAGMEVLNLFNAVHFSGITFYWFLMFSGCGALYLRRQSCGKTLIFAGSSLRWLDCFIMGATVVVLLLVGIAAFLSPPNTWDALTCHLPRTAHWLQNHSLVLFPTTMPKQLFYLPGAAYIIAQLNALTNSDALANLPQYLGLVGAAAGAGLLAAYLGSGMTGQCLAAFLTVSIPMAILQGSSAQNDLLTGFWIVCFTVFVMRLRRRPGPFNALMAGLSLGLALSIKGTGYLFCAPILAWLVIAWIKYKRFRRLKWLLPVILAAVAVVGPFYLRNFLLRGNLSGSKDLYADLQAGMMTPGLFLSNVARNAAVHLGTESKALNAFLLDVVNKGHEVAGVDINDPRSTFSREPFHFPITTHEDGAGQFTHLMLFWLGIVLYLANRHRFGELRYRFLGTYLLAVTSGFLLFCALVKFTPHCTRYQLPLFLLAAPFLGTVFKRGRWRAPALLALTLLVLISSHPFLLRNASRRLISKKKATVFNTPRVKQYFQNETERYGAYAGAVNYLRSRGFKNIGLVMPGGEWEYPFFALLKKPNDGSVRIEHVEVSGKNRLVFDVYPLGPFSPEAVIVAFEDYGEKLVISGGGTYSLRWKQVPVSVYSRF